MQIKYERKPNGTVTLVIDATTDEVLRSKEVALESLRKQVTVPGFRQGKAPANLAEGHLREEKILDELLSDLVNQAYTHAIDDYKFAPITQPSVKFLGFSESNQISLTKLLSGGIKFELLTFTTPDIELKNWEAIVKKVKPKNEKQANSTKLKNSSTEEKVEATLTDVEPSAPTKIEDLILEALVDQVKFEVAPEVIQGEADQILYRQIQTVQRLGVSYEDFLKIQKKSIEEIQKIASEEAEKTIRVRFLISEIAKALEGKLGDNPKVSDVIEYLVKLNTPKKEEQTDPSKKS